MIVETARYTNRMLSMTWQVMDYSTNPNNDIRLNSRDRYRCRCSALLDYVNTYGKKDTIKELFELGLTDHKNIVSLQYSITKGGLFKELIKTKQDRIDDYFKNCNGVKRTYAEICAILGLSKHPIQKYFRDINHLKYKKYIIGARNK